MVGPTRIELVTPTCKEGVIAFSPQAHISNWQIGEDSNPNVCFGDKHDSQFHHRSINFGSGGRDQTCATRFNRPLPYHLATPEHFISFLFSSFQNLAPGVGLEPTELSHLINSQARYQLRFIREHLN